MPMEFKAGSKAALKAGRKAAATRRRNKHVGKTKPKVHRVHHRKPKAEKGSHKKTGDIWHNGVNWSAAGRKSWRHRKR